MVKLGKAHYPFNIGDSHQKRNEKPANLRNSHHQQTKRCRCLATFRHKLFMLRQARPNPSLVVTACAVLHGGKHSFKENSWSKKMKKKKSRYWNSNYVAYNKYVESNHATK